MALHEGSRRRRWRSVAGRSLGGSLAAAGLLQLLLVVSGILVARTLGPQDRGYLALLVVISGICTLVGSLGVFSATTYYIAREPAQARRIVASLRTFGLLQVLATLALQAAVMVALLIDEPARVQLAALISLMLVPGILAYGYGEGILLGQQRFTAFNVLRVLPTAAYVASVLVIVLLGVSDLVLVMTMWAGSNLVFGLVALVVALSGLPKRAESGPERGPIPTKSTMTRFGLKSLVASLSPIEVFRLDQAVVGLFLTPVALGLYVVAQAFTNLPRAVASSIGYVAYPQVAARATPTEARATLWKYFLVGLACSALVVAGLLLVVDELVTVFFGSEYATAAPIAKILLVGTFFSALRRVLTDGMKGLGYPGLGAISEVVSWIVLVPAAVLLLPSQGATGVALALTLAWGISLVVALALAATAGTPRSPAFWVERLVGWLRLDAVGVMTGRRTVLLALSVAAAAAAGAAVALLSLRVAFVLILALVAVGVFAFGRAVLNRKAQWVSPSPGDGASWGGSSRGDFRGARVLYYLGLVSLALLTVRAAGQITLSDVFFLVSFMLACAELVILRRDVPIRLPLLLLLGMAIFSIGGLLSTFASYEAVKSAAVVLRLIFLTVFWFWLGTVVLNQREHVRKAIVLWVVSAALCGFAAVLQLVAGDVIPNTNPVYGRSTGFTNQPNDLGGLAAIAFVPALMLAARRGIAAPARLLSYVLLLLVASGLILSGSVGALLAALAAIFVWFTFQRSSTQSMLAFATIGAAALAMTGVQAIRGAPTPLDRFESVTASPSVAGEGSGSLDSRIATYRVVAESIRRDPFVGVGLDLVSITKPFGIVSYEYDVHNLIIGTWYKAGLLGLAGILVALFAVFKAGWSSILESQSEGEQMAVVALVCSFVAFVVFAMGAPVLFSRYGWISAALLLAIRAIQVTERETSDGLRAVRRDEGALVRRIETARS